MKSYLELKKALATEYPNAGDRRAAAKDMGLDASKIDLDGNASTAWSNILATIRERARMDQLRAWLEIEYKHLIPAFEGYVAEIQAGEFDEHAAPLALVNNELKVKLLSRRPARERGNEVSPVRFDDRSGEPARTLAEILAGPHSVAPGAAAVLVAHHPKDVEDALLEYDEVSRLTVGARPDDVAWIRGDALYSLSSRAPDSGMDEALVCQLKPPGVNPAEFAEAFEARLDDSALVIVIDFSCLALNEILPLDPQTSAHLGAVVRACERFVARLRAKGHICVVGLTRPFLAFTEVLELIRSAPNVLVAAALFDAPGHDRDTTDDRLEAIGAFAAQAIRPLLHANSPELRRQLVAEVETLAGDPSAREADLERQLRKVVALASRLEEAGFLDPAYRLEQFCRDALTPVPDERACADLWARDGDDESAHGYLERLSDLPAVGERVLITGHAGFDESALLRNIERSWILPQHPSRRRDRKGWLPLMLDTDLDLRRNFESRAKLKIGATTAPLRGTAALARAATAVTLPWLLSSPLLLLATELGDAGEGGAVACFLHGLLNEDIGRASLILTVPDAAYAPFLETWFAEDFASHIEARLRPLDLTAAVALVAEPAAKEVRAWFAAPDSPLARYIGEPYVIELIEAAARLKINLRETTLFDLVRSVLADRAARQGAIAQDAVRHELPKLAFDGFRSVRSAVPEHVIVAGLRLGLLRRGDPPRFTNRLLFDYFVAAHLRSSWTTAQAPLFDRLRAEPTDKWDSLFGQALGLAVQALDPDRRENLVRFLIGSGGVELAHRCFLGVGPTEYARSEAACEARNALLEKLAGVGETGERLKIADALDHCDPRISRRYDPAVFVPLGDAQESSRLARFLITNSQFACFVEAGAYNDECFWTSEGWDFVTSNALERPRFWTSRDGCRPNHPVVGVSFHEALAFCRWFGQHLPESVECGLPRARDWLQAAGIDRRVTSGATAKDLLNFAASYVAPYEAQGGGLPIGLAPPSQLGASDLLGNVWQWCDDWFAAPSSDEPPSKALKRPAPPVIVHGGPATSVARALAALRGGALDPHSRADTVGFRVLIRRRSEQESNDAHHIRPRQSDDPSRGSGEAAAS